MVTGIVLLVVLYLLTTLASFRIERHERRVNAKSTPWKGGWI